MGIDFGQTQNLGIANVPGPQRSIREVETLVGREAVDQGGLYPVERITEGGIGYPQTSVVGNILTQGEVTVGMNRVEHDDVVVLFGQNLGPFVKLLGIGRSPPVVQVSVLVELTALVIKPVGHFVADYYPDTTVVDGIVGIEIKEGRLQNTGREANLVGAGIVVGIHRLRAQ